MIAIVRNIETGVEHRLQQWHTLAGLDRIPVDRDVDEFGRVSQFGVRCHGVSDHPRLRWAVHAEPDLAA